MKHTISTLLGLLLATSALPASTISVTTASNYGNSTSIDLGTFAVSTSIADEAASAQNLEFLVSGLDIDGSGGTNDTVTLAFSVSGVGETNTGGKVNLIQTSASGGAGWFSLGGTTLNAAGEYVQVDFSSMSVNLNGVAGSGNGISGESFDGFTGVSFGSWATGHTATANGISVTWDDQIANENRFIDLTGGGNDANLKSWWDTALITGGSTDAAGTWRPESFDFQFSVNTVPEPGSVMLLCLGGLALVRRRR